MGYVGVVLGLGGIIGPKLFGIDDSVTLFIRLRLNTLLLVGVKRRSRLSGAAGMIGLRFQLRPDKKAR